MSFQAFSSFKARVLNAFQDLHASIMIDFLAVLAPFVVVNEDSDLFLVTGAESADESSSNLFLGGILNNFSDDGINQMTQIIIKY